MIQLVACRHAFCISTIKWCTRSAKCHHNDAVSPISSEPRLKYLFSLPYHVSEIIESIANISLNWFSLKIPGVHRWTIFLVGDFSREVLIDWLIDWLNKWMNEWMNEWMIDWLIDWMNESMNQSINQSINQSMIDWLIVFKIVYRLQEVIFRRVGIPTHVFIPGVSLTGTSHNFLPK